MRINPVYLSLACALLLHAPSLPAEETQDLFTTRGNSELPNVLYITPWRELQTQHKTQQLTLHSLYGDLFEPIEPRGFAEFVRAFDAAASQTPDAIAEHR